MELLSIAFAGETIQQESKLRIFMDLNLAILSKQAKKGDPDAFVIISKKNLSFSTLNLKNDLPKSLSKAVENKILKTTNFKTHIYHLSTLKKSIF